MGDEAAFASAQQAANDEQILAFGRVLGAANRLKHILARAPHRSTYGSRTTSSSAAD